MKASMFKEDKSRGPLYLQLATTLRRDIANGILKPGEKLPTISALAEARGVSIITIRQAIEVLEAENLLRRYQGKGTFVTDAPKIAASLTLRSDWGSLLEHLADKRPTLIRMVDKVATPMLDPRFGRLEPEYRFMRRVHSYDDLPYALINIYLSQRIADLAPKAFEENMVISQLSQMPEARIARMQQRISFTTADAETAGLLQLPENAAIGNVLRVITDADGNAIYIGQTRYRGDFVNLEFDIQEPPK